MNKLKEVFNNPKLIHKCLDITEKQYRQYDPGWYLYDKILRIKNIDEKFTDEFIELVYVTLSAWNMNSRGARLSNFESFKNSIKSHKKDICELEEFTLIDATNNKDQILTILKRIFYSIELVDNGKPLLVTFSKAMHFYLPNLIVPIDRKYTLNFFYGNININKKMDLQWKKFVSIFEQMAEFAKELQVDEIKNNRWSKNIPKIIDNLVIGYVKVKGN